MYIIYIANDPVWLTSCLQIWHNMSHLSRCCHEVPEPQPIPIHGSFGELDVCLSHLLIYIYIHGTRPATFRRGRVHGTAIYAIPLTPFQPPQLIGIYGSPMGRVWGIVVHGNPPIQIL